MRRLVPLLLVAGVAVVALVVAAGSESRDDSPEARVERISEQLRCPTCQGLSVADSPASTARAIRDDVARRVAAGESDGEIKQAYVDRYGEWILLRPQSSGLGALLWAVPIAVIVGAGAALALAFRRWRAAPVLEPSDADRALVDRALADRARTEGDES